MQEAARDEFGEEVADEAVGLVADRAGGVDNRGPPGGCGAPGLDVDVAWRGGSRMTATGNSFAAPHIAGYAALIRANHPEATPFEVKAILAATATVPRS